MAGDQNQKNGFPHGFSTHLNLNLSVFSHPFSATQRTTCHHEPARLQGHGHDHSLQRIGSALQDLGLHAEDVLGTIGTGEAGLPGDLPSGPKGAWWGDWVGDHLAKTNKTIERTSINISIENQLHQTIEITKHV